MNTRGMKIGAIGVLAVAGAGYAAHLAIRHRAEQARSNPLTQIVKRSAGLYKKIAMSPEPANLSMVRTVVYSLEGKPIHIAIVQIGQEWDETGLILNWNEETSELMSAKQSGVEQGGAGLPILSTKQASQMSATWLRVLGVASLSPQWKLSAYPQHEARRTVQGVYTARWISPNRAVDVTIQHRTGDLLKMVIRNLPIR